MAFAVAVTAPAPIRRRRRPRTHPQFWLRRVLILILALVMPMLLYRGYHLVRQAFTLKTAGASSRMMVGQPVYLAILGVDERDGDTAVG